VSLVGYSFGAWVGLTHAQADARVAAVAAIGLVAWRYDADLYRLGTDPDQDIALGQFDPGFLQTFTRPKLFVVGEHDSFATPENVQTLVDRLPDPKLLRIIPGTAHFLLGHEQEAGHLVAEFLYDQVW
jgi:pimeloyl-ACP methyl ester carboxylesterase